ncbi:uncharacterized protein BDV17DRAFT_285273 [Aspergillus undulatus]|uniref:uncharacterized protein n=1 Tax=Aspergillus undulatus TaxID=1810928 RepID=UPI003CCDF575
MASLSTNWYLRDTEAGCLDKNVDIYIHYGEVFCRVPDCSKSTHNYKTTNNLRTHIETHDNISLPEGTSGGRVPQKLVDEGLKWYKSLYGGLEPGASGTSGSATSPSAGGTPSVAEYDPTSPSKAGSSSVLPPLPVKKDGSVHVTNMRAAVTKIGHKVPCDSCSTRNDYCKDINHCDFFYLL